jgi:hypothetical protein
LSKVGTYCADKLRSLRQEIARKRRGKLTQNVLLLPGMRQFSHPKLRWLLQLTAAYKSFPFPNFLRT